jgi:hypothetical protein
MSLVNVTDIKTKLEWNGTDHDDYFTSILPSLDSLVDNAIGRPIQYDTHTEYYSGDGSRRLSLRQGPIDSVTSLSLVTYGSSGAESLDEYTENVDYYVFGVRTEQWTLPGWLEASIEFVKGRRNYKVVYDAGYNDTTGIPQDLKDAALYAATWMFNKSKDAATLTRDVGDGGESFRTEEEFLDDLRRQLSKYRSHR